MQKKSPSRHPFRLNWPEEQVFPEDPAVPWFHPDTNFCLDFHGDLVNAQLVVLSDGNHHMALRDCLELFARQNPELTGVFYATTPPAPIVNMLKSGGLKLGNLILRARPHVFISPPFVLDDLAAAGYLSGHEPFVRNQGSVLLVKKGNPANITGIKDLARKDIRLFMSSPDVEKVSFSVYLETIKALAPEKEREAGFPDNLMDSDQVVLGNCIHHREAPQAVAEDKADAAIVFYHLGLRYKRIFPHLFEIIPLGGSIQKPAPLPGNVISHTHMGLVDHGGLWGEKLLSFLKSKQAMDTYHYHGLLPLNGPEGPWPA